MKIIWKGQNIHFVIDLSQIVRVNLRFCPSVFACTPSGGTGNAKDALDALANEVKGRNDVDTEFEMKAFQVCDKDGDGALDWQEVENCEVNKMHFLKNDFGNTTGLS